MPANAFCKIEGIDGDSKISGFEKQIELLAYNHGIYQPPSATPSAAGSMTVSAGHHKAFTVVKSIDQASPKLMLHCANGKHINKVEVTLCRAAGDQPVPYVKWEFEDVVVSSIDGAVGDVNGDRLPDESVGFTYGKIKMTYTHSESTGGTAKGTFPASYDLRTGKGE
jgi:type VI secretion system secreted protein Hcp